jgi:hypothetical protein
LDTVVVVVEGFDLPGLRCRPGPGGDWYENVHVGVCVRGRRHAGLIVVPSRPWAVWQHAPGDAARVRWAVDVDVSRLDDGYDFRGPFVRGARGDRHIGPAWGEVPGDGTFRLFRGAKLRFDCVEAEAIEAALAPGARLVASLGLTDGKGHPVCASVGPPVVAWAASAGERLAQGGD